MESNGLPMWGSYGGSGADPKTWGLFTCTDCHDPHGSSNYRILKDSVNQGVTVGGYLGNSPQPFVVSNEIGYPGGGWDKGQSGADEIASYQPSYTAEKFANSGANKSMSNWCAGCHTAYATRNDVAAGTSYDYGQFEAYPYGSTPTSAAPSGGPFSAGNDAVGNQARHRHPVNIAMTAAFDFPASSPFSTQPLLDSTLPLEMPQGTTASSTDSHGTTINWNTDGFVGCLTCHYAHGTSVTETGWANAELQPGNLGMIPVQLPAGTGQSNVPAGTKTWTGGTGATQLTLGVNPGFSSALLRDPNRGVCERCHNK